MRLEGPPEMIVPSPLDEGSSTMRAHSIPHPNATATYMASTLMIEFPAVLRMPESIEVVRVKVRFPNNSGILVHY